MSSFLKIVLTKSFVNASINLSQVHTCSDTFIFDPRPIEAQLHMALTLVIRPAVTAVIVL